MNSRYSPTNTGLITFCVIIGVILILVFTYFPPPKRNRPHHHDFVTIVQQNEVYYQKCSCSLKRIQDDTPSYINEYLAERGKVFVTPIDSQWVVTGKFDKSFWDKVNQVGMIQANEVKKIMND